MTADTPSPRPLSEEERALWTQASAAKRIGESVATPGSLNAYNAINAELARLMTPDRILSLLTALASEREAGERYKAALDDTERKGYEWASEDFNKPESARFAALATIASEALNPQTEADTMDCRDYCK